MENKTDEERIQAWLKIGNHPGSHIQYILQECENEGIGQPWGRVYFSKCLTIEELHANISTGWGLGQTFYFENFCFINLEGESSKFAVIRDDVSFETIHGDLYSLDYFKERLSKWQAATVDELVHLCWDTDDKIEFKHGRLC